MKPSPKFGAGQVAVPAEPRRSLFYAVLTIKVLDQRFEVSTRHQIETVILHLQPVLVFARRVLSSLETLLRENVQIANILNQGVDPLPGQPLFRS